MVDNFKSLKDFVMPLDKFNVLIGSNGSGKTNVLEFFSLMSSCISPQKSPAYPFAYWGGYKNLIWSGNERESLHIQIRYNIDGYDTTYDTTIASSGNDRLKILEETFRIDGYMTVARQNYKSNFSFDAPFVDTIESIEEKAHMENPAYYELVKDLGWRNGGEFTIPHTDNDISILKALDWTYQNEYDNVALLRAYYHTHQNMQTYSLLAPIVGDNFAKPLYKVATDYLTNPENIILLRHINYDNLRQSTPINYSTGLDYNGDGLINLLFQWFSSDQKLPPIITHALKVLFPGWQIHFQVTQESNIIMQIRDGQFMLAPTSIPDGFYKLLAILVAVKLNPKILLIDEIETSLHARAIEYIIGILKNIESTVIITTHSPFVVDSVDIEDLILMENTGHKTTCRKIKDPEKLKLEFADRKIATSDSWLYGEL